ncbi:MAG: hypothetical protein ACXAE3_05830 [Candidatus Kariarchaeaceae archaeon]
MDIVHRKTVTAACGCTSCVNLKEPRFHAVYNDRLVYFCSRSCVKEYNEDPEAFINSDHFKIEFDILDTVTSRSRENVSKSEIEEIEQHRKELADDDLLVFTDIK